MNLSSIVSQGYRAVLILIVWSTNFEINGEIYTMFSLVSTWMDIKIFILSEVSKSEKDKYHLISLICGIKKKKEIELQN